MTRYLAAASLLAWLALGAGLGRQPAAAQNITIDGTLSPAQTLAGPNYTIGAGLGKQVGPNLFQSFGRFGLVNGESATFTGPASIANIVGRVTGGSPSSIDGLIHSAIAGANLFLVNPFGIVFGPHAALNVSGSFHAATADYLKLADGAQFQATHPDGSTFSAAAPAAFGFLGGSPAAITVNGGTLSAAGLDLAGGPVTITKPAASIIGSSLASPGGTIQIVSVAGPGEIPVNALTGPAATVSTYGAVAITGGAAIEVASGGNVMIRAGTILIDASTIDASNTGRMQGGRIRLQADDSIAIENNALVQADTQGSGNGGEITLATGHLTLAGNATVQTSTSGDGGGGAIDVSAGSLTATSEGSLLTNTSGAGTAGSLFVDVGGPLTIDHSVIGSGTNGPGKAGDVIVGAATLTMTHLAIIGSDAFASGSGGETSVTVSGQLAMATSAGITAAAGQHSSGNAGSIIVSAGELSIASAGGISASTFGQGNGGDVSVTVNGLLSIIGTGTSRNTGITSDAEHGAPGNSGNVTVSAGELSITRAGVISSATLGRGNAGNLSITVAGQLSVDGAGAKALTGITAQSQGRGSGGDVRIAAGALSIANGAEISSTAFAGGDGGAVSVSVTGLLTITGIAGKSASAIAAATQSRGNAGAVTVSAGELSITDNGIISSVTYARGNGGSISVNVGGSLTIVGAGSRISTGISADSNRAHAGEAGNVTVRAGDLAISGTGEISSATKGAGNGGSIVVTVAGLLSIAGVPIQAITGITSQTTGGGRAGNITVGAGELSITTDGQIGSDTFGAGGGGNISVSVAAGLSIVGDPVTTFYTGISANSAAARGGNAGNVTVVADTLAIASNGEISSSTVGRGNGGSVSVDVSGVLTIGGAAANAHGFPTGISGLTRGRGAGGQVAVAAGTLVIDDGEIAASAQGPASREGGTVQVTAGSLAIENGGVLASTTAGSGSGGALVVVANTATLAGAGTEITAQSTGSGTAGSIAVDAGSLQILDGAAISTAAASANGGDIGLAVGGVLYLRQGAVTTSVFTASGNGGNIAITAPQVVMTGGSRIVAQAFRGHGGDIAVGAGAFVPAADSLVSASSQLGISGTVTISGEETGLNSSLVVLPGNLRSPEAILRSGCAVRGARPRSSLVEAGRGSLPQTPAAALPALYLAPRAAAPAPLAGELQLHTGLGAPPGCPEAPL